MPRKATVKKATKKVAKKKSTLSDDKPVYKLTIVVGGQTLTGEGETALLALRSITPPVKIFTKADIELVYGDKRTFETWQPARVKRLFYPLAQNILSKQLEYLLR